MRNSISMKRSKDYVKYTYTFICSDLKLHRRITMRGRKRREGYATIGSYVVCSGSD